MKLAKKKKVTEPRHQTTTTSSPTRGANQDQSGVGVKHDTADYTISDETKMKIKDIVNEVVAGVSGIRNTPVNMKTTSHTGGSDAPASARSMQRAADARRAQLDKQAQQQRDQQQKTADQQKKQREAEMKKREAEAAKKVKDEAPKPQQTKPFKEDTMRFRDFIKLDEAQVGAGRRGRPKKNQSEEDPGSEHIMMQMRKVISTRGDHKITHVSGEKSSVHPQNAHKILQHHDNLKTPAEKQAYAARIHKSKASMADAVAGKPEEKKPKVSLAGKITGTQK